MESEAVRSALAQLPEVQRLFQHLKGVEIYGTVDLFATAFIKNSFLTWYFTFSQRARRFGSRLACVCPLPSQRRNSFDPSLLSSLTFQWKEEYGGTLRFRCRDGEACPQFVPKFNSVVLFCPRVDPALPHEVSEVVVPFQHQRYAYTGWYFVKVRNL